MASQQVLLQDIINSIKDIMENYKEDKELKLLHQKKIDQAAAGGIEAKSYVKEEIMKVCLKDLNTKITEENIDSLIKQKYLLNGKILRIVGYFLMVKKRIFHLILLKKFIII